MSQQDGFLLTSVDEAPGQKPRCEMAIPMGRIRPGQAPQYSSVSAGDSGSGSEVFAVFEALKRGLTPCLLVVSVSTPGERS